MNIKINYEIIEMMLFYWDTVMSRDKVIDSYFKEIADREEMQVIYDDEFNSESLRKVLSAINNRERLNNPTKKESRFWNLNMWMLEDAENTQNMLKVVKSLNIDKEVSEIKDSACETLQINFVPGHDFTYIAEKCKLTINFFKLMAPDFMNPEIIKIEGMDLKDFVLEKLQEVIK